MSVSTGKFAAPPTLLVYPNPESLLSLTTAVLMEQHDEWAASNRRYLSEESLRTLTGADELDQGVIRQLDIA